MSTPRRGVRRPPSRRRPPAAEEARRPRDQEAAPAPAPVTAATATGSREDDRGLAPRLVEWTGWIVLWVSAVGAGFFLGAIPIAKALFVTVMLALTVLPWLRWVRPGSPSRLRPARAAMLLGILAIVVAFVLALSDTLVWSLPLVVVGLALATLTVVLSAPRPART